MPAALDDITVWTFVAECPIPNDLGPILVPCERPYIAYKTFRDSAIFTDRRRIDMWSSENDGHLDHNAEMELWTRAGHVKIKLGRGVDIRRLDNLISQMVLGVG